LNLLNKPKVYCNGNWTSSNAISKFAQGPCVAISGIGIIGTPYKTVYIIDRSDHINTYLKLPNGLDAYAEELDLTTGAGEAPGRCGPTPSAARASTDPTGHL